MPHLSFIKRKPEPLGAEFKCIADVESGVMLSLEVQEGKIPMARKPFHNELGATAACTKRLVLLAGFEGSGRCIVGDSWFASLKTAKALRKCGVYFIGNVKTAFANFPRRALQQDCRPLSRGDHTVYKVTLNEDDYIACGWKCGETKTTMTLIASCGTNQPGSVAKASRQDASGNHSRIEFPRPRIVELYQQAAGAIDYHNRVRQGQYGLEKRWITTRWDFRIHTTIFSICLADTFLMTKYLFPSQFG